MASQCKWCCVMLGVSSGFFWLSKQVPQGPRSLNESWLRGWHHLFGTMIFLSGPIFHFHDFFKECTPPTHSHGGGTPCVWCSEHGLPGTYCPLPMNPGECISGPFSNGKGFFPLISGARTPVGRRRYVRRFMRSGAGRGSKDQRRSVRSCGSV